MAMYTSLFYGDELPYFLAVPQCLKFAGLVLVYPYAMMLLVREIDNLNAAMLERERAADSSLMKFYDEFKRLKLTIAPSALLYINAEGNYVKIHYLENGRVRGLPAAQFDEEPRGDCRQARPGWCAATAHIISIRSM